MGCLYGDSSEQNRSGTPAQIVSHARRKSLIASKRRDRFGLRPADLEHRRSAGRRLKADLTLAAWSASARTSGSPTAQPVAMSERFLAVAAVPV